MNQDPIRTQEAREALEAMQATRSQLANLGSCPPWRHAAFGGVMALLNFSLCFGQPIQVALFVLSMAGVALIAAWDRRRYGVFVNGYRRGRTRMFTFGLLAVMLLLLALQVWLRGRGVSIWIGLSVSAATFVIATVASVFWNRIFRAEMEQGA
ncbi:MAG: hypothetical protein KF842_10215 [Caulobacter sp.]|nr:hypothetical protein [Caulobacter sp.]